MKREEFRSAVDTLTPSPARQDAMLQQILAQSPHASAERTAGRPAGRRRAVPVLLAAASAAAVAAVTLTVLVLWRPGGPASGDPAIASGGVSNGQAEIAVLREFTWNGRRYMPMSDSESAAFGLTQTVRPEDIGPKLTDLTGAQAVSAGGDAAYAYTPAGCDAIVAVEKDGGYRLFRFLTFESYEANGEESVSAYLTLYGIHSAEDIAKIQFIKNGAATDVTDAASIAAFYGYYEPLRDDSAAYFNKLASLAAENASGRTETPASVGDASQGQSIGGYDPWAGKVNPLAVEVTIRIVRQNGLYYETPYYPLFGFISRHEVSGDFAAFLAECIG